MNPASERSIPYWAIGATMPHPAASEGSDSADVLVIGSGIAGLSTAYELASAGKTVIVIDRGPLAGGMSSRTTAHLACDWDDYYHEVIDMRGADDARLLYRSQAAAIDRIEEIQEHEAIACDFSRLDGYLFEAPDTDAGLLQRELEACHEIGFSAVDWAPQHPVAAAGGKCLRFPRQGRFHPVKYLNGLAQSIVRMGGKLYPRTAATHVEEKNGGVTVHLESGDALHGEVAVLATNSPITDLLAMHAKQAPYRTYVIAGRVPADSVPDALIWDTMDPYHYVRVHPTGPGEVLLIAGGEDHKTGEADDMEQRFLALGAWTQRHFPSFTAVEHRWSGQVCEPVDTIPFIGRNPGQDNVYIATGDSGQGMTTGALAGMLIRELVLKQDNAWAELYDPRRTTLGAVGEFVRENVTAARQMGKHLTGGTLDSLDQLKPGEGAIVGRGTSKVAAYRAESGRLYVHSGTCTHAGCVLEWNPFEICWDCPCHGSQFAPEGGVLNGPAVHGLKPAE